MKFDFVGSSPVGMAACVVAGSAFHLKRWRQVLLAFALVLDYQRRIAPDLPPEEAVSGSNAGGPTIRLKSRRRDVSASVCGVPCLLVVMR